MTFTPRTFRRLWQEFKLPSWHAWDVIEDCIFALPINDRDKELAIRLTGRTVLPSTQVRELFAIVGRGGGKSRFIARLAVYFATGRTYKRVPGEKIYISVNAPDKKQAGITLGYISGLLNSVPSLKELIEREAGDSIELANGVVIEVIRASKGAARGRSIALAIVEEAAFLPTDESTDPDTELLRSLRPGLGRVPNSLLVVVSSPYARKGELYTAWRNHYGNDDSQHTLIVQADTLTLNPTFDQSEIERAYLEDPTAAESEYGANFRGDIQTYINREVIEACVNRGCYEIQPMLQWAPDISYQAFCDPSGGFSDSMTLAIGHVSHGTAIVDCVRERKSPFVTTDVVEEFSNLLKTYKVKTVTGDKYAGSWPLDAFKLHGITYEPSAAPKSDLYKDALPLFNAGRIQLLDIPAAVNQISSLERRTARGGRDSIDHPPKGHDDIANSICGLGVHLLLHEKESNQWATFGKYGPNGRGVNQQAQQGLSIMESRRERNRILLQRMKWARDIARAQSRPSIVDQLNGRH